MEELNKRDLHKNFAVLLRYIVDDGFGFLEEYILHRRTKGDDAPTRRCRRKIFKALCSLLLFFRLGMRIINYSFQKRRQNKPCFSLKAEDISTIRVLLLSLCQWGFQKKQTFFWSLSDKKVEAFQRLQKQGSNPRYHDFFLLALLKPRKVLWSLKSNAVSAITTAQWKTDLLFSYSLNEGRRLE